MFCWIRDKNEAIKKNNLQIHFLSCIKNVTEKGKTTTFEVAPSAIKKKQKNTACTERAEVNPIHGLYIQTMNQMRLGG